MRNVSILTALALLAGCAFFNKGYRVCGFYGPAGMCVDKPHTHDTNGVAVTLPQVKYSEE